MRCVFGIDVSSKTCNVAVVVNEQLVDETKLSLDMIGFNQLKTALDDYTDLKQPERIRDDSNAF